VKYLPLLLLLTACVSTPLTEEQVEERAYYEQERQLAYEQWRANCISKNGVIYVYDPWRVCRGNNCIPHKWDWRYDFDRERPMHGNAYQCITRAQLREVMRNL